LRPRAAGAGGVEKNSTIIFPAQFMTTVQEAVALLSKDSASK
jgi:hypothetical protein